MAAGWGRRRAAAGRRRRAAAGQRATQEETSPKSRGPGRLVACAFSRKKKGVSLFFAKTAGKEPRRWSGPTQLPHTRAEQLKRIVRRLLPSHGRARAKEPRHRTSEEQAVLEIQARALGLLMAFESGGEGKLRLRDCDLVHFMTTATESQPKSRRFVVVKAICCRSTAAGTLRGDQTLLKHSF